MKSPSKQTGQATDNKLLRFSSRMALIMGIFLPLVETIRRFNQLSDPSTFINWFDDYLLGFVLLYAVLKVLKNKPNAVAHMIAAWGIVTGAIFLSFLGQFQYLNAGNGDPGIFSAGFVAVMKGLILTYMLVGMLLAIKANE